MPISLIDFEQDVPFAGDYEATLAALRERITRSQVAQIVHDRRAIILVEGVQGAGKKDALKLLTGALDPCHVAVHCIHDAERESGRHWLAPYWSRVPRGGETSIFFRSWYRDAVDNYLRGALDAKDWARACDEINEFEAQQTDHGTLVVKLFFHVGAQVQARRLREQNEDPWLRALAQREQDQFADRASQIGAWNETFKRCDTRWAKWNVLAAGDGCSARIAALEVVAQALEKSVPKEPPSSQSNVVSMAAEREPRAAV